MARLVYGFHPVREALRGRPGSVERVLVLAERRDRRRRAIEELCGEAGVPVEAVSTAILDGLVGGVHNGFVAETRAAAAPARGAAADPELLVLVEDVQDPRNLGALLRVCEGAGVGRVLVRDRGSAPLSETVARTSAGATEWLDVERIPNTARVVEELKEGGFWVYGAAAGGKPPWEHDLAGKVLLCFGGEERGLRQRTRRLCDGLVGLPMRGRVESLNVATAAAAILYEAVRQRAPLSGAEGGE